MKIKIGETEHEITDEVVKHYGELQKNAADKAFGKGKEATENKFKKAFKDYIPEVSPEVSKKMQAKEIAELVKQGIKEEMQTVKTSSDTKIKDEEKKTTEDFDTWKLEQEKKMAAQLAENNKKVQDQQQNFALNNYKNEILSTAIQKDLLPKQKEIFQSYVDNMFDIEITDGEKIVRKKNGELFTNSETGLPATPIDIVKEIKNTYKEAFSNSVAGAGINASQASGTQAAPKIDLNLSSSELMRRGASKIPKLKSSAEKL